MQTISLRSNYMKMYLIRKLISFGGVDETSGEVYTYILNQKTSFFHLKDDTLKTNPISRFEGQKGNVTQLFDR